MGGTATIQSLNATAFTIPTEAPESDGTLAWDATTIVVVEVSAGGCTGLGYSYTDASSAPENGMLRPDRGRAGLGVEFRRADAAGFLVTS